MDIHQAPPVVCPALASGDGQLGGGDADVGQFTSGLLLTAGDAAPLGEGSLAACW